MASDTDAKRRASFARADRVAKQARQKTEQARVAQSRAAERDRADRQRKAEAVKAAEQRNALARKRAEQRRLERHRENLRNEFSRKAGNRKAHDARAEQQRHAEATKAASQKQAAAHDRKRREAEAYVAQQEKRQQRDQQEEHRRQTHRLRVEHQAQRAGFRSREAAGVINHARQVRNIDIAERRDLDALGVQRRSLVGRAVGLVRGPEHFDRQERAIVDRHENDRWRKHRDLEAKKEDLFRTEQAARLRHVAERHGMAKHHQVERRDLVQAQENNRSRWIDVRAQALSRANDNQHVRQPQNVRPTAAFGHAAGQGLEIKR